MSEGNNTRHFSTTDPDKEAAQAEHDRKMAEKGRQNLTSNVTVDKDGNRTEHPVGQQADPEPEKAERPADVPEKFWDAEKGQVNVQALLKSQQDMERQARGKQPADDKTQDDGDKASAEETDGVQTQESAVAAAQAEFAESGKLSDDTYAALEKTGLSKSIVDNYIGMQSEKVNELRDAAFSNTDGEEGFNKMAEWARANMSEEDRTAIDAQLASSSKSIVAAGAKALAEAYRANTNDEPDLLTGDSGNSNAPAGDYYKSGAEMQRDMRDPKYAKDPAFREEVMAKLKRSKARNIQLYR